MKDHRNQTLTRVLLIGGTESLIGGVEKFCARACSALTIHTSTDLDHCFLNSAIRIQGRLGLFLISFLKILLRSKRGYDVIWLQYANLLDLFILLPLRFTNLPIVVTPHLGDSWVSQRYGTLRRLTTFFLRRADLIVTLSDEQSSRFHALLSAGPPPIARAGTFLPNSVFTTPPVPTRPRCPNEPLRLSYVARLRPEKGLFIYVALCHELVKHGMRVHGRIAGTGPRWIFEKVHRLRETYGLMASVDILGPISESDVVGLLQDTDYLVHLSTEDSYPLVVLEAIACGAIPVCLPIPGTDEILRRYGGLSVDSRDPAAIARLILESPKQRALNRKALFKELEWANVADQYARLLRDVQR